MLAAAGFADLLAEDVHEVMRPLGRLPDFTCPRVEVNRWGPPPKQRGEEAWEKGGGLGERKRKGRREESVT